MNKAIYSYIKTNNDSLGAVKLEIDGKITYPIESVNLAKKEASLENKFLREFGVNKDARDKINTNFSELI